MRSCPAVMSRHSPVLFAGILLAAAGACVQQSSSSEPAAVPVPVPARDAPAADVATEDARQTSDVALPAERDGSPDTGNAADAIEAAEAGPESSVGNDNVVTGCDPNCTGVLCGGSDGCGGSCTVGCSCIPECGGVFCGGSDGCGGV